MGREREAAEMLALKALGWIAARDDLLPAFLGATGASPDDVRRLATDGRFLGGVLDFLLSDEAWVLAFARDEGIAPDAALRARAALPGGDVPHWT